MNRSTRCVQLAIAGVLALSGADRPIDTQRSTLTVHVRKAGILSAAAHDHWVDAPVDAGVVNDSGAPRVEFSVRAAALAVKPDPKVDSKTQAEIQKDMQDKTLESKQFPEINFRSSRVESESDGRWRVEGLLTLHGTSRPIVVEVKEANGEYTGETTIRQTDFGIRPIRLANGLIKIRDELDVAFHIATKERPL